MAQPIRELPPVKIPERTPGYMAGRVLLGIFSFGMSEWTYTAVERERFRRTPKDERVRYEAYQPGAPKQRTIALDASSVATWQAQAAERMNATQIIDADTGQVLGDVVEAPAPSSAVPWALVGGLTLAAAGAWYWTNRTEGKTK